jgi:alpha-D-ribose 1-methylphosphonate 5-triphosphate synthase subunit PhnG
MQVTVATAKTMIKDEAGRKTEGLVLTCSRCGGTVEVFGTTDASVKRGFVKLREGCEEAGRHFYVEEELHPEPPPPRPVVQTE